MQWLQLNNGEQLAFTLSASQPPCTERPSRRCARPTLGQLREIYYAAVVASASMQQTRPRADARIYWLTGMCRHCWWLVAVGSARTVPSEWPDPWATGPPADPAGHGGRRRACCSLRRPNLTRTHLPHGRHAQPCGHRRRQPRTGCTVCVSINLLLQLRGAAIASRLNFQLDSQGACYA
jgi:hypothetical protein